MSGVRLRGHHLICLRFFFGEGYPERFRANLGEVIARAGREGVLVVSGPDDVCSACPDMVPGDCPFEADAEGEIARLDALAESLLGVAPGDDVGYTALEGVLGLRIAEWRTSACEPCEWREVCEPRLRHFGSASGSVETGGTPGGVSTGG